MQLQRAKWAQNTPQLLQANTDSGSAWDPTGADWHSDQGWVAVASPAKPRALWSGWDHGEAAAGELIVQVGALGHESRKVKAITTRFCTNGNLNTVVLSNGVFV